MRDSFRRRRISRFEGHATRRALFRTRRQDWTARPPQRGLHALEYGRLPLPGIDRPTLQEHSILHDLSCWAGNGRSPRQYLAHQLSISARSRETLYSFGAVAGPVDYYLFYGPTPKQVVETYAWLTGTPPLPPLWALGYQQSRYSYMSQDRVLEVANRLRADRIPADAIYLDIDYQDKNRPFTVNRRRFPIFPE